MKPPCVTTVGKDEAQAAYDAVLAGPLSGYLGGEAHGGPQVEALEREWAEAFGTRHAVACNSATSGLLIACLACGVGRGTSVVTTPYTMSATAAAPAFLGAEVAFGDIEARTFCFDSYVPGRHDRALIVTNLFGHPAQLKEWRRTCDYNRVYLIEDNAQAIGAMEYGRYAGTVGHIGVWSLNVHKQIQAGEGGICTTDNDELAHKMRMARNHGELAGGPPGLNLRMTEVTAAIARVQLRKREQIIAERIEIAETLSDMVRGLPGITPPVVHSGCKHVFYMWAAKVAGDRERFIETMAEAGMPLKVGYVMPLYRLAAFRQFGGGERNYPATEQVEASLVTYENCAQTPSVAQLAQWQEAFKRASDGNSRPEDWQWPPPIHNRRTKLQP